jgi:stage V sporulation protein B
LTGKILTKQTIIKGALILTLASILIRVLGAVYRIPLARMLGAEGMGIYAVPNQFYLLFFTISSAGIPVAVARLVSEKMAAGHYRDAHRTFTISLYAMSLVGLAFSLLLLAGSPWLVKSGLVANPASYYGLIAVTPIIFFSAVTASMRGLFQGLQYMSPVAVSQVADQVMLVIATVWFSYLLLPKGLAMAAAGANLGALPGAVAASAIMAYYYFKHRKTLFSIINTDTSGFREETWPLLKRILSVSVSVSFASVALAITWILDNKLIIERLQLIGYSVQNATALYGQFNQMAMSFINISIAFALSLGTSLVPSVSEAYSTNNPRRIGQQASTGVRMSLITTLPAAAGLFFLAPQLTEFVFADSGAGIPLAALAPAIVFWGVHLVLSGVMQGLGRADIPVYNLLAGIFFKIGITYYLTPTWLGIKAAAYGTVAMFIVSSILNFLAVRRMVGLEIDLLNSLIKPGIASLIMGLTARKTYLLVLTGAESSNIAIISAVLVGAIIFPILIILSGCLHPEDLKMLPRIGDKIQVLINTVQEKKSKLLARLK